MAVSADMLASSVPWPEMPRGRLQPYGTGKSDEPAILMSMAVRVSWRTRVLALPVFVLIVLQGCASVTLAPQRERVVLKTSTANRYYPVRGLTTTAIFDDIDKNGLFDNMGRRALGQASANWNMDWQGTEVRSGLCEQGPMTITLNIVVTLPEHKRPSELAPDIKANWQRFAARVAAHEQRHVDIYLSGAGRMKNRMEALLSEPGSCAKLDKAIRALWVSEQANVEKAQDQFHVEDDAKSQDDRRPLQAKIDVNQKRLSAIASELKSLDQTLDALKQRRESAQDELNTVKAEMSKSRASPPICAQAGLTSKLLSLCQRYNALVATYNALVEENNEAVSRRNRLVHEHNGIVATTNTLIEAINWTR